MRKTVEIDCSEGIAAVTLRRPRRLNAINGALLRDFAAALRRVNGDEAVGVVVLKGAGRAFCAGDDLKEFESQARCEAETRAFIEDIQEITRLLVSAKMADRGESALGENWERISELRELENGWSGVLLATR